MAINFPNTPALNDIYTVGGTSWKWDGTSWNIVTGDSPASTFPMLIVRKTATQALAASTSTVINFASGASVVLNRGGFTVGAADITIPTTGYYRIKGTVYWDAAVTTGNNKVIYLYVNGAAATRMNSYGGLTSDFIAETTLEHVYLVAGDLVHLSGYQTSPSSVNVLSGGTDTNWAYGTSLMIEYKGA